MNLYKYIINNKKEFVKILTKEFPRLILWNCSHLAVFIDKQNNCIYIGSVHNDSKTYTPIFAIIDEIFDEEWFFKTSNLMYMNLDVGNIIVFNFLKKYEEQIIRKEKLNRILDEN